MEEKKYDELIAALREYLKRIVAFAYTQKTRGLYLENRSLFFYFSGVMDVSTEVLSVLENDDPLKALKEILKKREDLLKRLEVA